MPPPRILVYGYGNPGRADDGLGAAFVESMREWAAENGQSTITFDTNYQLNIEDALLVSGHDIIIFVDAAEQADEFIYREIVPSNDITFSTHAMAPESVLALCEELYGKRPRAFLLTIRGSAWEAAGAMTEDAKRCLLAAEEHAKKIIIDPAALDDVLSN
ncbi:MAG: hydrogenase maturation protease [Spirochaetota bacterium]